MEKDVPQYLHLPQQIVFVDSEEATLILLVYVLGMLFGWAIWLGGAALAYLFFRAKRNKPRGYLRHTLYALGIYSLEGYPPPAASEFHE